MKKEFNEWSDLKEKIDKKKNLPTFKQREVWWCSIGINVGYEENGKNKLFNRPVLIIRKFNNNIFLGVPLSSKIKDNKFYHQIHIKGKINSVLLSQIRVWGSNRLTHKLGSVTKEQFDIVREEIRNLI